MILGTPLTTDTTDIRFADVFGRGTACLLWSYEFGTVSGSNYKVLDFNGGTKPYLLAEVDNNLGTTTRVAYGTSTDHYLADAAAGLRWATPLPFPVQVVDKTEVIDHLSKTKLVTGYRYHHGYFDGHEREFRGFGRVDQFDSEGFAEFTGSSPHEGEDLFDNGAGAFHVPPVETRTWFHTGAWMDARTIEEAYEKEYWPGDSRAFRRPIQIVDNEPEAFRALRGAELRQEVYGHDGSSAEVNPYRVTETGYRVRRLHSPSDSVPARNGVYLALTHESISSTYERAADDPRVQQVLNLEHDDFGNILRSVALGYPRRRPRVAFNDSNGQPILGTAGEPIVPYAEQRGLQATYTFRTFINDVTGFRRVGVECEAKVFELHGLVFEWSDPLDPTAAAAPPIDSSFFDSTGAPDGLNDPDDFERFDEHSIAGIRKRLIDWKRVYFKRDTRADSLGTNARMDFGEIDALGLPFESYRAAFDTEFLMNQFGSDPFADRPASAWDEILTQEGAYSGEEGFWWIPSGRAAFDSSRFFQPALQRDPHGNESEVQYDAYGLLTEETLDSAGNRTQAVNDYRVLSPCIVKDPNGNHAEALFDALGQLVATAVMGKAGQAPADSILGLSEADQTTLIDALRVASDADSLAGLDPDQSAASFFAPGADPLAIASSLLGQASSRRVYDMFAYRREGMPAAVGIAAREVHHRQPGGDASPFTLSFLYSDGFGRKLQTKSLAEKGPVVPDGPTVDPRWVASGTRAYNNKGEPVREFEPFFTGDFPFGISEEGVSPTILYDPLERVIGTLHPDHNYEKVVFDAWVQTTWDRNDTVLLNPGTDAELGPAIGRMDSVQYEPTWYKQRTDNAILLERWPDTDPDTGNSIPANAAIRVAQQEAAAKAAAHAATPTIVHLDALGRSFLTVKHNRHAGSDEFLSSKVDHDIEGNPRTITDPRGVPVFAHTFDLADRKLVVDSRDAGLRRQLPDIDGKLLYRWDAENRRVRLGHDTLRRPIESWVKEGGTDEYLAEKTLYGEDRPSPEGSNHRGRLWRVYDGAGRAEQLAYDVDGNLTGTARHLLKVATSRSVEWPASGGSFSETGASSLIETTPHTSSSTYDALGRVTRNETPDGTVQTPQYNAAGLLEGLQVSRAGGTAAVFIDNIDYNARRERVRLGYGNGVTSHYDYDPETFRLFRLTTSRGGADSPKTLQALTYTYDPAGNVTEVRDDAQHLVVYNNQAVEPRCRYTYDALYQLRESSGREHKAMTECHYQKGEQKNTEFVQLPQPISNGQALANYTETYTYDASGNLSEIRHAGHRPWTRTQNLAPDSNRLETSQAGCVREDETITHDGNGNIRKLPHLEELFWDHESRLVEVQLNVGPDPDRAHYRYDASGQRVHKTVTRSGRREERIYLGGYEIYVERDSAGAVTLRRDTVHVLDEGRRIALIEDEKNPADPTIVVGSRVRYQLGNLLDSTILEVDGSPDAKIISYEEYYPFGGTAYVAGNSETEVKLKRYRYAGRERDDETGLYYYGARYLAPWLGRWLSPDPMLNLDHANLYVFARNNPVANTDPLGLESKNQVDPQKSKVVGKTSGKTVPVMVDPDTGYAVNIDPSTGVIEIKEGDWLTKALAALTGSTDPERAQDEFEVLVDGQWLPFGAAKDPDKLQVGDKVRFKRGLRKEKPAPPKSQPGRKPKSEFFGGKIDKENQSVEGHMGIKEQHGQIGVKALRGEGTAGEGGTFGSWNTAGVGYKIPHTDVELGLDTPKASGGIYLGHTTEKANGDLESTYGIEALASAIDLSVQDTDAKGGAGLSGGLGAGAKVKVAVTGDENGVKSVTFDLEGKFLLGLAAKFTVPNPFREQPEKQAK